MAVEASNNFLVPNATFIVEVIAFVIILVLVWRYILPPLQKGLRAREEMVRQQVADSDQAKKDLADAERKYQEALNEARTEAAQIRENARAEGQRTVEEMHTKAQEDAARIVARGEEQLSSQRSAIVRELRDEVGTLAVELSEKIVDQRLASDEQVSGTVDSFIAGLEGADKATSAAKAD